MSASLSDASFTNVMRAKRIRRVYLEVQAALWVVLSEQKKRYAANSITNAVNRMISQKQWLEQRKELADVMGKVRGDSEETFHTPPAGIKQQFIRYGAHESHWWSVCEILYGEAAQQRFDYNAAVGQLILDESRTSTPLQIQQLLLAEELPTSLESIEKLLTVTGLLEREGTLRPGVPKKTKRSKLLERCNRVKGKFTKQQPSPTDRDLRAVPVGAGL